MGGDSHEEGLIGPAAIIGALGITLGDKFLGEIWVHW